MTETAIKAPDYPWLIITAVMLTTVMEILDSTIVNVSLPHMMGSLSADRNEISWVLTSYIVASGILMPISGFLINRLGARRLLLMNIIGFMLSSALCGLSANLSEMILFRIFQGICGASLVPLSQFILRTYFPLEDQPRVMAIWGVGVMAAPIMGPTIGGYITDALNWRWIFYLNVPVCLVNFFLVTAFLKESPLRNPKVDWLGMFLIVLWVGSLQLFLDRGSVDDWFESSTIWYLVITFIITFTLFIIHVLRNRYPIINLRLFLDRTFSFGTLALMGFAASLLASLVFIPQMLETWFGYTPTLAGLVMAPRGIASGFMMFVCAHLIRKMDVRLLMGGGLLLVGGGAWALSLLTLDTSYSWMMIIAILQGIGVGAFYMPLATVVYSTLPQESIAEATGLFSFGRNLGNAMGISLLTTYLDRDTQFMWTTLGSHLNLANPNFTNWLSTLHLSWPSRQALQKMTQELTQQANFVAYLHTFRLCAFILFASILAVCFMRPRKIKKDEVLIAE